jgi:hypothetical protein
LLLVTVVAIILLSLKIWRAKSTNSDDAVLKQERGVAPIPPPVARKVYCYWGGGKMSATRKKCFEAMKRTLGVPVVLVTDENIGSFFTTVHPLHPGYWFLKPVHRSDYIRSYFMNFYGGGYADIKMPTKSWVQAFDDLDAAGANMYGNGSREGHAKHLGYWEGMTPALKTVVAKKHKQFLSNCNFVFRPHTPYTEAWYTAVQAKMDKHYAALKRNYEAALTPKPNAGAIYPLRYVELQGEVFHRVMHNFLGHFLYTLPALNFAEAYR